jgi:hypothetical protein
MCNLESLPVLRRARASRLWRGVNLGVRPSFTPRALVRARINSRWNSARPPRMVTIKRPCGVVVSPHVSPSERNPALFFKLSYAAL